MRQSSVKRCRVDAHNHFAFDRRPGKPHRHRQRESRPYLHHLCGAMTNRMSMPPVMNIFWPFSTHSSSRWATVFMFATSICRVHDAQRHAPDSSLAGRCLIASFAKSVSGLSMIERELTLISPAGRGAACDGGGLGMLVVKPSPPYSSECQSRTRQVRDLSLISCR